jgi:hypothetical protein
MNPLRYINDWKTVAFTGVICTAIVLVFVFAGPDERLSLLTTLGIIGTAVAASMRAAFAAPAQTPKRIELPRKSDDDDDGDAGGEVLAEEPATKPLPRAPQRVTLSPRVALAMLPMLLLACSPSALQSHATVAVVASVTMQTIAPVVTAGCAAVLDACHADDACLERAHRDCRTAGAAYESALATTRVYMDAVDVAASADESSVLPALTSLLSSLTLRWNEYRAAFAVVGVSLPPLPPAALELVARLQ